MRKFYGMASLVILLVSLTACRQSFTNPTTVVVNTPTTTSNLAPVVKSVAVSTPAESVTLNACPMIISFSATVIGDNLTDGTVRWTETGGGEFTSSGNTATLKLSTAGVYVVRAIANQDGSTSGSISITATGNCGGGTGGGTQAPTVVITPNPGTINYGQSTTLTWSSVNATSCNASRGNGSWSGPRGLSGTEVVTPTLNDTAYTISCTGPGGTTEASARVFVNGVPTTPTPTPSVSSVNVAPKTATCTVGGQMTFGASVTVSPGSNLSTAVTWSTSDATVASVGITSQNQVVFNCLKAGTVTVRATSVADTTKSDTGTGTVTNGVITCTFTVSAGLQSDGSVSITKGQVIIGTATCSNATGGSFLPAWFSSDPSRVGVKGDSQTTIGGAKYETGNGSTVTAVFTGQAIISVQAAISQTSPSYSRLVVVK